MYKYFETMADVGVTAQGTSLEEAFRESAKALFNLMVDIDTIGNSVKKEIEISSEDIYSLFYDFLTELLVLRDTENLIFSDFDINIYNVQNSQDVNKDKGCNNKGSNYKNKHVENDVKYVLKCIAYGEKFDRKKHEPKEEVKAITYHKMEIKHEHENSEYINKKYNNNKNRNNIVRINNVDSYNNINNDVWTIRYIVDI